MVAAALLALLSIPLPQILYQGSYQVLFKTDHNHTGYYWLVDLGIPFLLFAALIYVLATDASSLAECTRGCAAQADRNAAAMARMEEMTGGLGITNPSYKERPLRRSAH